MNQHLLAVHFLIAAVLLAACNAQYRDISANANHKAIVGQVCQVATDLRAHGLAMKQEREKKTDYITIWNPGFTGPELTFLVVLKPGTKLQILAVRECSNCPFDRMLEFQVKVTPEPPEFADKPAYLRAESKKLPYLQCPANAA